VLPKQSASQTCAALALGKSRHFVGSILLVIGVTALLSSHSPAVFAEPCDERVATAETYSVIEIDFYAYLLKDLAQDAAIEPAEDACAIKLYAAIDTNPPAGHSVSSRRSETDADWWSEE
jgi:hypothetical protein